MKIGNTAPQPAPGGIVEQSPATTQAGNGHDTWNLVLDKVTRTLTQKPAQTPDKLAAQVGELLKLQGDLHRYQLRVEMLSKVADSALVTIRKLQQTQ